jgi:hypothetical protein
MNENDLNKAIEEEIAREEEARALAEFAPPPVSNAQVKGAKVAWMTAAGIIDLTTAYALYFVFFPYWWYAVLWGLVGAGGLIFQEWLWERVGNNKQQTALATKGKNVSAVAIMVMAVIAGIALIMGWQGVKVLEVIAMLAVVGLACFHAWTAYQYHEIDDDYIAVTVESRAEADNQKAVRQIHRAGARVEAKKRVHMIGAKYQEKQGGAFAKAAGQSYASTAKDEVKDFTKGQLP